MADTEEKKPRKYAHHDKSEKHAVQDHIQIDPPTVSQRASAALYIVTYGAERPGIATKFRLMHPRREFSDAEALREASSFLASVHTVLLATLHHQVTDQILKAQDERLSFVLDE